jgi:uncharacterized protein
MVTIPLFPLETVLFPGMPLNLRVFETRYLRLIGDVMERETREFGVVLINHGSEVGGGESRFPVGVMAEVVYMEAADGPLLVSCRGGRRFAVEAWESDEPYPTAEVNWLPDIVWRDSLQCEMQLAEVEVRSALAVVKREDPRRWPSADPLSADPVTAMWQLAALIPMNPLDQVLLLEASDAEHLLERIRAFAAEAVSFLEYGSSSG